MHNFITSLLCVAVGGAAFLFSDDALADCAWTVKGKLEVDHRLAELASEFDKSSLANVQVKVSAKEKVLGVWGTWNAWPTVRTGSTGLFSVSNTKNCDGRRFKIEVKFSDDDLEVRHEHSTSALTDAKWYTIVDESSGEHAAGTTDFGTRTFASGGAWDLNDDEAWSHADIWVLYKKALAVAASYGGSYAFTGQVQVKYPHNSDIISDTREASYVNPTTKVIYIFRSNDGAEDHFNVDTLLHELGHRWAYNHTSGEFCLTETLAINGDTHGTVGDPCVAFHEGFAEFFADEMERALVGGTKVLPYARPRLNAGFGGTPLTSEALMQRNDDAWTSVFHTLSTPLLHQYEFGTASSGTPTSRITKSAALRLGCASPDISFKEVLSVFLAGGTYTEVLSRGETTIEGFLERAAGRLAGLDEADGETIEKLVDPASTLQPSTDFCPTLVPGGVVVPIKR